MRVFDWILKSISMGCEEWLWTFITNGKSEANTFLDGEIILDNAGEQLYCITN